MIPTTAPVMASVSVIMTVATLAGDPFTQSMKLKATPGTGGASRPFRGTSAFSDSKHAFCYVPPVYVALVAEAVQVVDYAGTGGRDLARA